VPVAARLAAVRHESGRLKPAGRGKLVPVVTDEIAGRNLPVWAAENHICDSCSLAYAQTTIDAVRAIQDLPAQLRTALPS
jgi:hypothetical protein